MNIEKLRLEFENRFLDKSNSRRVRFHQSAIFDTESVFDFFITQFQQKQSVEISDKEIAHYWKRKNCTGTYLEGLIDGSIWMKDKQGIAPKSFKMPSDKQMIEIAILFNEGGLDPDKLGDMVGYGQFIVDRLYENGDVSKPSLKEGE